MFPALSLEEASCPPSLCNLYILALEAQQNNKRFHQFSPPYSLILLHQCTPDANQAWLASFHLLEMLTCGITSMLKQRAVHLGISLSTCAPKNLDHTHTPISLGLQHFDWIRGGAARAGALQPYVVPHITWTYVFFDRVPKNKYRWRKLLVTDIDISKGRIQ